MRVGGSGAWIVFLKDSIFSFLTVWTTIEVNWVAKKINIAIVISPPVSVLAYASFSNLRKDTDAKRSLLHTIYLMREKVFDM